MPSEHKSPGKIKGWHIAVIIVIMLGVLFLVMQQNPATTHNQSLLDSAFNITKLNVTAPNGTENTYWAYTAVTQAQQERGYMNQTGLGDCRGRSPCIGMIFLFSYYINSCFWMKNTEIALQQSWVAQNGLVTYVYNGTPESTSIACGNGTAVIETLPGQGIRLGDKVSQVA